MKIYYDFHIHSCLSPCGDSDMTPNNIINMAKLNNIDVIALTDHNSCLNCEAAIDVGNQCGVLVLPGMELNTAEEVHVVCLFSTLDAAQYFSDRVYKSLPDIINIPDIFGLQTVTDNDDNIIDTTDKLLINASSISITDVYKEIDELGGFSFPAHIDKNSFSILSNLGDFPSDLGFTAAEIFNTDNIRSLKSRYSILNDITLLKNSDAHFLKDIIETTSWLKIEELTPISIIESLKSTCINSIK